VNPVAPPRGEVMRRQAIRAFIKNVHWFSVLSHSSDS
jgi:hypothetical protein